MTDEDYDKQIEGKIKLLRKEFEAEGKTDKAKAKFIKELKRMKKEAEARAMTPMEILDIREKECEGQLARIDKEIERDKKIETIGWIIAVGVIFFFVLGGIVGWIFGWIT